MTTVILSAQAVRSSTEIPANVEAECQRIMSKIMLARKTGKRHILNPLQDTPADMQDDIVTIFTENNYTFRDAYDPKRGKILCW